jgi:hypothetical protein
MYLGVSVIDSTGFRTNEAMCQLSYEAPYLGPEGLGRPGVIDIDSEFSTLIVLILIVIYH